MLFQFGNKYKLSRFSLLSRLLYMHFFLFPDYFLECLTYVFSSQFYMNLQQNTRSHIQIFDCNKTTVSFSLPPFKSVCPSFSGHFSHSISTFCGQSFCVFLCIKFVFCTTDWQVFDFCRCQN